MRLILICIYAHQSARIPTRRNNENHSQLDGIFRHSGQHRRPDRARQYDRVYLADCGFYVALQGNKAQSVGYLVAIARKSLIALNWCDAHYTQSAGNVCAY